MSDNLKNTARIPIILGDFKHNSLHKDRELLMDYDNTDIYLYEGGRYINITGRIKDQIDEIQDGSMVIHICTEDTLPLIKDRPVNHWYYVITKAEELATGEVVNLNTYIYYGVVSDTFFDNTNNYVLIAQNMITDPDTIINMSIGSGYRACFYVPTHYTPTFYRGDTTTEIEFEKKDRLYVLDNTASTLVPVDVYVSKNHSLGDIEIKVSYSGGTHYGIKIESNDPNIEGLQLPSDILVKITTPPSVIGPIPNPIWTSSRFLFRGWSKSKVSYDPVNPLTFAPDKNMILYAYFEYKPSSGTGRSAFNVRNISTTNVTEQDRRNRAAGNYNPVTNLISTYSGEDNIGVSIIPKDITGYITPDEQVLTKDNQIIVFEYVPERYEITFNNIGVTTIVPAYYTIEDEDIYPDYLTFMNDGQIFDRWEPEFIPSGSTGDKVFTAVWKDRPVLEKGSKLNEIFDGLARTDNVLAALSIIPNNSVYIDYISILQRVRSVNRSEDEPDLNLYTPVDISITSNPILAWYVKDNESIQIYCEDDIYCNNDMTGAFENMTSLRDIRGIVSFTPSLNTKLDRMFNNCIVVSDFTMFDIWEIEDQSFVDMFNNTAALEVGRVPYWYSYKITVTHRSYTGKLLLEEEVSVIPGYEIFPKAFNGYHLNIQSFLVNATTKSYIFDYSPIEYTITYNLQENVVFTPLKLTYTIEDEDFIPANPSVPGKQFSKWSPERIDQGTTGNITLTPVWVE